MSLVGITDVQLDRLLGQVSAPSAAAPGLADRIIARALRTPQARLRSQPVPRRRRRWPVWSMAISANVLAVAAAAASWDGQRFDFQRLADLPHRLEAVIRIHRRHDEVTVASARPRLAPHALFVRQMVAPQGRTLVGSVSSPEVPAVIPSARPHSAPSGFAIARSHELRPKPAAITASRSSRRLNAKEAERNGRQSGRAKLAAHAEQLMDAAQPREALDRGAFRAEEQSKRRDELAERQRPVATTGDLARSTQNVSPVSQPVEPIEPRQEKAERGGGRRWRDRFFKRPFPRQRDNRFRRRF